jgi:hypothetical protein
MMTDSTAIAPEGPRPEGGTQIPEWAYQRAASALDHSSVVGPWGSGEAEEVARVALDASGLGEDRQQLLDLLQRAAGRCRECGWRFIAENPEWQGRQATPNGKPVPGAWVKGERCDGCQRIDAFLGALRPQAPDGATGEQVGSS